MPKSDTSDTIKKRMILEMEHRLGIVSSATKACGISRETHYNWLKTDASYKAAIEDISEHVTDLVEGELLSKIRGGDTACILFYLKTRGKKRGYSERVEQIQEQSVESKEDKVIAKLDEMIKKLDDIEPDTETENRVS